MADTKTMTETEPRQRTGVAPHQGVEVVDADSTVVGRQSANTNGGYSAPAKGIGNDDAGFGHADLRQAEVIHGEADTTEFRSTDLRDSELNRADFTSAPANTLDTNPQGTNWGTILIVIVLILAIILIGSWLF